MNEQIAQILRQAADDILAIQQTQKSTDERIQDALNEGIVYLVFRKLDGSTRTMLATRDSPHIDKNAPYDPEQQNLAVIDLELGEDAGAVRSFRFDRVERALVVDEILI